MLTDCQSRQAIQGTVCWNELNVHDVDRAKNFYCKALGWSLEEISPGGFPYWPIAAGDVNVDGLFHMVDPRFARAPERWVRSISPLIQLMGE
jgi:predicted enzyme related to lactoylglutathione lyase